MAMWEPAAKQKTGAIFPLAASLPENGFVCSNLPASQADPARLGSFRQLPPSPIGLVCSNLPVGQVSPPHSGSFRQPSPSPIGLVCSNLAANSHPGFEPKNKTGISPRTFVSSTPHWAWPFYSYETASARLVQRYYNSNAGRFYTPDPIGMAAVDLANPTSWNLYAYVNDDPGNFNDPRGLFLPADSDDGPDEVDLGIGAGDSFCFLFPTYPSCNPFAGTIGPSTQGGGKNSTITVANYTRTSSQAIGVQNSLRFLGAELLQDPTCSNWLTGNQNVISTLVGTGPNNSYVGVGNFSGTGNSVVNAVAGVGGTNLPAGSLLTVNLNGAYFNANVSTGYMGNIAGGTPLAQAFILLHELGHLTQAAGFQDNDSPSTPAGQANQNSNNLLVEQNCAKTLDFFGGHF
jgi:RHS repeat-associated protein